MTLANVAEEIQQRVIHLFARDAEVALPSPFPRRQSSSQHQIEPLRRDLPFRETEPAMAASID